MLNCPKIKGQAFEPVLMKLNQETRWFDLCDEKPEARPEPLTAQDVANFVAESVEARSGDIKKHFAGRGSVRTIADRIADAERLGLIAKANQKAPWRLCNEKNGHLEEFAEVAAESTDAAFVQYANPIRDCTNAQTQADGGASREFACCPGCGAPGLPLTHCDRCGEFLR